MPRIGPERRRTGRRKRQRRDPEAESRRETHRSENGSGGPAGREALVGEEREEEAREAEQGDHLVEPVGREAFVREKERRQREPRAGGERRPRAEEAPYERSGAREIRRVEDGHRGPEHGGGRPKSANAPATRCGSIVPP